MSRAEVAWRLRAMGRAQRDRLLARIRTPRWDRDGLAQALAPEVIDPVLRTHLDRKDWRAVQRSLARAFKARPRLFPLEAPGALELRSEILRRWPEAAADASRRADEIMGGRYDVLGHRGLSYTGPDGRIDWHLDPVNGRRAPRAFWSDVRFLDPAIGDHKVIWEINRHQHWLALGRALWLTRDRRYGWAIVSQLQDWLDANPPLVGINWASMLEIGFRSLSWVWALHFLLADANEGAAGPAQTPWLVDLLVGLDRQLRHVEQNLSTYFSPNTHLTGEALALYVAGLSVPELAASGRWAETGRNILLREIDRQLAPDGGHVERSTHYHRYSLDFYLLALLMAERAQDTRAIMRFTEAVTRAAEYARALADDEGRLPLLGDDDGGMLWPIAGRACSDVRDTLALAAVLLARPDLAPWGVPEEVFWIAGRTAIEQEAFVDAYRGDSLPPSSRAFPDTGYVVARDGQGGHLVFDVGPHGYLNCGHAHADALSITLALNGRPLLVDPGTATYTVNLPLRDAMRSAESHNTLTIDGREASVPAGPFHWRTTVDARLETARHNPAFDWVEASHDGYLPARHRRSVVRTPAGGWLIIDEVGGRGRHSADLHWHFDPEWTVRAEGTTRIRAMHPAGGTAWIVHDGVNASLRRGERSSAAGWMAPVYGTLVPIWSARIARTGIAPFVIVTYIAADAPVLTRIPAESDPGGPAVALRVLHQDVAWTTVLRPGEAPARETRGCNAGAYHTDARLLHYGSRGNRLLSISVCDASHVLSLREGWLSLAADEPVADLHAAMTGERLDVYASTPPSRIRLQGALVRAARTIRLNGRELPASAGERDDSVVILRSHWPERWAAARPREIEITMVRT